MRLSHQIEDHLLIYLILELEQVSLLIKKGRLKGFSHFERKDDTERLYADGVVEGVDSGDAQAGCGGIVLWEMRYLPSAMVVQRPSPSIDSV